MLPSEEVILAYDVWFGRDFVVETLSPFGHSMFPRPRRFTVFVLRCVRTGITFSFYIALV